ncbi:Myc-type [Macleaya cordata]|uniref:Myc-type n=1 Tax=Macleaya cordata TaxID=56857 RepID=A0A200PV00_MACCD|nr:Myc-type [Macleaya cordata]
MATNEGFHEDPLSCEGYSQLMDSDMGESFIYSPPIFHSAKPPTMLCFGNVSNSSNKEEKGFLETGKVTQKSGITGSDSSSASSSNNSSSSNSFTKSKRGQIEEPKKTEQEIRNGLGSEPNQIPLSASGTISGNGRTNKKPKKENPTSSGPVKVRKEKLGERITALQQLVSPFGKTDTASVLHEAMGYIRFLHDQVQLNTQYMWQTAMVRIYGHLLPWETTHHPAQRTS